MIGIHYVVADCLGCTSVSFAVPSVCLRCWMPSENAGIFVQKGVPFTNGLEIANLDRLVITFAWMQFDKPLNVYSVSILLPLSRQKNIYQVHAILSVIR